MATYQVKTGDTIGAIAKRYGVPTTAVTGFRSQDPNTIFPDEVLEIDETQKVTPQKSVADIIASAPPAPMSTDPQQPSVAGVVAGVPPAPMSTQPPQPTQPIQPQQPTPTAQTVPKEPAKTVKLPTGQDVQINERGDIVDDTGFTQENVLESYGLSPESVDRGFQMNPYGILSDLVSQVMGSLGLPDVRDNLTTLSNEIESVANERDAEIAKIQDNPWISAGSKSERIQKIQDKYELKIANRQNKLTLLQNSYQDARQQAQFAVTTAVGLYDKQRTFDYNTIKDTLDREEKRLEAERKLGEPLSVAEAKTLGVPYGTTAAQAYGITPRADAVGLPGELTPKQTSVAIQLANSLKSHPAYTDMQDIATGMSGVQTGLAQGNGFGDITAINAFQRMVDPGATVREGDVALIQTASAFLSKVLSDYPIEKLAKGSKLPDATRAQMRKTAQDLYTRRASNYNDSVGNQYKNLSAGSGISFEYVGQDFPINVAGVGVAPPQFMSDEDADNTDPTSGIDIQEDPTGWFDGFLNIFGLSKK